MQAVRLERQAPIAERPLALVELPDPEPGPGELRIRVGACAVCRTDLHVVEGDLPERKLPIVPGHQAVGVADRLGPGAGRFRLGERVGIAWLRGTCGSCAFCRSGRENLCAGSLYTGWDADGGFAEFALVPEAYAYRIPEVFSDVEAAPLLCAGIIGYRALRRSGVAPGGRLGLFGFGSSARVVLRLALHRGCEVFVATRGPARQDQARRMGAAWAGGLSEPMPAALDSAIVFSPDGESVPPALRALRKGGVVALAGIHMSPIPSLTYAEHLFHEKELRSVEANTRADGEELLREAAEIPLRPRTVVLPLAAAAEALGALAAGRLEGTAVLVPDPEHGR